MSAEEVADTLRRVDKNILDGKDVSDDEKSINITDLYQRYKWGGAGPTPLPDDAKKRLRIEERTTDSRWMSHFDGNGREVGVYRTVIGYYWLLKFDSSLTQHWLVHVGTAADVADRYGK